jgi:hypothetical protein
MVYFTLALNIVHEFMKKHPTFPEKLRKQFYNTAMAVDREMLKENFDKTKDHDLILNGKEKCDRLMESFSKEISK